MRSAPQRKVASVRGKPARRSNAAYRPIRKTAAPAVATQGRFLSGQAARANRGKAR
ncbi:hypothetical protein D3C85_780380 [compost metagenome]